jgi:hypothetical protein
MKNKERYAKEIMEIACSGNSIAVTKEGGSIASCCDTFCVECLFCGGNCKEKVREWTESECIEKPVISKKDKTFLECIGEGIKYIARDMDGFLFIYCIKPHKLIDCWESGGIESNKSLEFFKLNLPMVKWSDKEPWLIEDLKKLEVVEGYENNCR